MRVAPRAHDSAVSASAEELSPTAGSTPSDHEAEIERAVLAALGTSAHLIAREVAPLLRSALQQTIKETVEDSIHHHLQQMESNSGPGWRSAAGSPGIVAAPAASRISSVCDAEVSGLAGAPAPTPTVMRTPKGTVGSEAPDAEEEADTEAPSRAAATLETRLSRLTCNEGDPSAPPPTAREALRQHMRDQFLAKVRCLRGLTRRQLLSLSLSLPLPLSLSLSLSPSLSPSLSLSLSPPLSLSLSLSLALSLSLSLFLSLSISLSLSPSPSPSLSLSLSLSQSF